MSRHSTVPNGKFKQGHEQVMYSSNMSMMALSFDLRSFYMLFSEVQVTDKSRSHRTKCIFVDVG